MRVLSVSLLFVIAALAGCADVDDAQDGPGSSLGSESNDGSTGSTGGAGTGGSSSESAPALGSASVYVQDAPEDHFSEVHVVFTHVLVHAAGADDEDEGPADNETVDDNSTADGNETANGNSTADGNETVEDNETEDDGSWIELVNNTDGIDIDLLNFSGNTAAFLGEEELLAGKYTQIRIHVVEAYGIDHGGNRTNISLANPVLKVVKSFDVEVGMESRILIEVDLDKSLKETGKKGWKMTPVIGKTVVDIVDDESSGDEVHSEGDGTELEDIGQE